MSGVVRIVLNLLIVSDERFVLYGAVVAGATGYALLGVWNIVILCKRTKIRFDFVGVILLPSLAFFIVLYACEFLFKQPFLPNSTVGLIIIKGAVSVIMYCILCFLCGMPKFKDFFCDYVIKKNH